jgi:hypothetical protein
MRCRLNQPGRFGGSRRWLYLLVTFRPFERTIAFTPYRCFRFLAFHFLNRSDLLPIACAADSSWRCSRTGIVLCVCHRLPLHGR